MRKLRRILGLVVGVPLLAGLVYQPLASAVEARRYPPPGRMIAVNGHRLHIRCEGIGAPTVVLEAGPGGSSLDWSLVVPELARQSRVCVYDRAGLGWSDPGPLPRTSAVVASELHTLLVRAEEPGPFLLAAHGAGALHAKLFAARYPLETAGLVVIDPEAAAVAVPVPAVLARVGLHRVMGPNQDIAERLPAAVQDQYQALSASSRFLTTVRQESEAAAASAEAAKAVRLPLNLPVVVLRSGPPNRSEPFLADSARGRLMQVEAGGGYLPVDRPDAVVKAVSELLATVRRGR